MLRLIGFLLVGCVAACAGTPQKSATGAAEQGACAVSSDLVDGIELVRERPLFRARFQSVDSTLRENRTMQRNGVLNRIEAEYEHPLAVRKRTTSNGSLWFEFSEPLTSLNQLPQLGEVTASLSLGGLQGGSRNGSMRWRFLGEEDVTIGGCSYPTWIVESSTEIDGMRKLSQRRWYSDQLGLVLLSQSLNENGDPGSEVRFDSIKAVR